MPKFYGTFPQRLPARNNYVAIEAVDARAAEREMNRRYGNDWAFVYSEAEFAGQVDRYGLKEIK